MSDVFQAIADPTRREILLMVAKKPISVNTIAEQFNMSRPAVSKHLRILSDCELITFGADDEDARKRICFIQLKAMKEVEEYMELLEEYWKGKLDKLGGYLDRMGT